MATITEDIKALRDIPAKWKGLYDPLDDLRRIRQGDEQLESSSHFYECTVCGQHSHCSTYTKLIVQEQLAEALNTAADKDRQIAVLTEGLEHYAQKINWICANPATLHRCGHRYECEMSSFDIDTGEQGWDVAITALAESQRIQEGENEK